MSHVFFTVRRVGENHIEGLTRSDKLRKSREHILRANFQRGWIKAGSRCVATDEVDGGRGAVSAR